MGSTLTNLVYHAVFSTKGRAPMIIPEIRDDLYRYMGGIVKREDCVLLQIGGISDHVHMVIRLKPIYPLSEIMKKVKGSSSKWINEHKRLVDKFAWQEGYGAFTVSESQIPVVIHYLQEQEKHHRNFSFKEEFIKILKRHNVDFDERYLWVK